MIMQVIKSSKARQRGSLEHTYSPHSLQAQNSSRRSNSLVCIILVLYVLTAITNTVSTTTLRVHFSAVPVDLINQSRLTCVRS